MIVSTAVEPSDVQPLLAAQGASPFLNACANLLLNSLRAKFGLPPAEYVKPPQPPAAAPCSGEPRASASFTARHEERPVREHARLAHVVVQGSAVEVPLLGREAIDACRSTVHMKPIQREEFTDAQLTAFKRRIDSGASTTWQSGLSNVAVWEECHQVFHSLALACGVANLSTSDKYRTKFKKGKWEYDGEWALALAGGTVCRMEHGQRSRSMHQWLHAVPATRCFCPGHEAMPWGSAIAALSVDDSFWAHNFEHTALGSLVAGQRSEPSYLHDAAQPHERAAKQRRVSGRRRAWLEGDVNAVRPYGRRYFDSNYTKFCDK